jgi:hypothetical protein
MPANRHQQALPRPVAAALWCGLLLTLGCGRPTFEEKVLALATPSGALASLDPQLPRLIRTVEQQRGLPLQLADPGASPSESNTAVALAAAYGPALHLRVSPVVTALLDPDTPPAQRSEFLQKHQTLVSQTADAADLPRCVFDARHEFGFFASMGYLDDATLATRLLLLSAQQAAAKNDRPAALADVLRALRVCHALARERRVEARVLAASLRSEALDVAAGCFDKGLWRRYEAEQLYGLVRDQLKDWPDDSRMLVGERATVIHAYEAIRAGMIHRLVTLEERSRLKGRVGALEKATPAEIDADQARYLRAMQMMIDAAASPFPSRSAAIAAALDEIHLAPTLFAATLFTGDLPGAMKTAAQDRATFEAWTLALAAVADLIPPPFVESPVSGRPLEVRREASRVEVLDGENLLVSLPVLLE